MKYLISGGGTGGHIFPAVSIADALRELDPEAEILFVGALGRMEMERVPQAGYAIEGLPIRGFNRVQPWKNVSVLLDLVRSLRLARRIIRDFRPDVGVGVGGYASGAAMKMAALMGVPIVLQEQNGFAGVTNRLLRNDAQKICVAYEGMEKFFPADKLVLTGNPVRQNLIRGKRRDIGRPTLLAIGGSLGARSINEAVIAGLPQLIEAGIHVVWQTGKVYYDQCREALDAQLSSCDAQHSSLVECHAFLSDMPDRYAQADLVISRAGASSISELCLLGKPSILVPSPNVAEDHQTHNAMALVRCQAAEMVRDTDARQQLIPCAIRLLGDAERLNQLHLHALELSLPDAAKTIAQLTIDIAKEYKK